MKESNFYVITKLNIFKYIWILTLCNNNLQKGQPKNAAKQNPFDLKRSAVSQNINITMFEDNCDSF